MQKAEKKEGGKLGMEVGSGNLEVGKTEVGMRK
jgi:hypothetical protein